MEQQNDSCAYNNNIEQIKPSPQTRFKNHFDNTIGWGFEKRITEWTPPIEAFKKANYLQFPQSRRQYICIDLDWEGAATIWMDEGFPEPTITFVNRENGHANLAYELASPVYWSTHFNVNKVHTAPIEYYKAIQHGYTNKLNGDHGYVNSSIKNPFSNRWRVTWSDNSYTLEYLAEFVELKSNRNINCKFRTKLFSGRNDELFYTANIWSYRNVKKYNDKTKFYDDLLIQLKTINIEIIPFHWADRGCLELPEITGLANGIFKYVWSNRDNPKLKYLIKNYGILKFDPIPDYLKEDEKIKVIKSRQAMGAHYTNQIRSNSTKEKIANAIEQLQAKGCKVSMKSISTEGEIGYTTVRKYNNYINTLL